MSKQYNRSELNIDTSHSLEEQKMMAEEFRAGAAAHFKTVKSSLKTFLITGLFVIALVAVLIVSFAWFANNKLVRGGGTKLNAEVSVLEAGTYDIYKASTANGAPFEKYSFRSLEEDGAQEIKLNAYDAVLDSNPYTSLYFRIPVYSDELNNDNIEGINFTIDCNPSAAWINSSDAENDNLPYLSSIIQLKCYSFPDIDANMPEENEEEYVYTSLKTAFEDIDDLKKYVDDSDTPSYTTKRVSFYIPKYNETTGAGFVVEENEDGLYQTYIYIEMDYSPILVAKYLGLTNSHIELGQQINIDSFLQDIILMEFSVEKTETN